ncbi:CAP domain-containing protein [Corynebacterium breve]|uniref:CAP domain-containing protein n=1 Tax=Corynebacterium breve TaxID=3049799 RepID=A0ABY8VEK3_9CORY|nr:CAP domain-containing protein [Corynebacterium breve]WIM67386.1 CAP domain-containing protein [Corynebacterium breve]
MTSRTLPAILAAATLSMTLIASPAAQAQDAYGTAELADPVPFTLTEEEFDALYDDVINGETFEESLADTQYDDAPVADETEDEDGNFFTRIPQFFGSIIERVRIACGFEPTPAPGNPAPNPGNPGGGCPGNPGNPGNPVPNPGNPGGGCPGNPAPNPGNPAPNPGNPTPAPNPGNPDNPVEPAPVDGSIEAMERAVFDQINQTRQQAGSAPLKWDQRIANESRAWSQQQAARNTMQHETSNYYYNNYGEILAAGPNAGETAVQQWIESQPHYLPMIYTGHTMGGVGISEHPTWGYIVTARMGNQ